MVSPSHVRTNVVASLYISLMRVMYLVGTYSVVQIFFKNGLAIQIQAKILKHGVRGVKGLLGRSPLGFISRLLRGQVNLSI